jgi:hypothetical protein
MAVAFEPLNQPRDLRRAPGAVGAFNHDQLSGKLFEINRGMP